MYDSVHTSVTNCLNLEISTLKSCGVLAGNQPVLHNQNPSLRTN